MDDTATPVPGTQSAEVPKGAWRITFLLLFYMFVNFADKIVVGLAGVPIMKELAISQTDFGLLGSAFFLLFSASAVIVGFAINKFETRWVLLALATIWALVQFPMITSVSYSTLLICRIILGAGEGPAASVAIHAIYKWFPDEKRAMPTALLSQGSALGVVFAVPSLNWLIVNKDWHWAFGALGVVGLLWVVVWLLLGKEGPISATVSASGIRETPVPYGRLFSTSTFIGSCIATFGAYWALSLGLTWFTPFIVKGLGFPQSAAGGISILPWLTGAVVVLLSGWISQMLHQRGVPTRYSRGLLGALPLILGGVLVLCLPLVDGAWPRIILLTMGTGLTGSIYVVCAPMIGEFTPVIQRGALISIYGAIYTLAGVVAPLVMGSVLDSAATPMEGYLFGYKVLGVVMVIAGIIGVLMLRPNTDRARIMSHGSPSAAPVAAE